MSEMLAYAPDLRSITAGQGDYTLEFLRTRSSPAPAQKVIEQSSRRGAPARPRLGPRPASRAGVGRRPAIPFRPHGDPRTIVTSQPTWSATSVTRTLLRGERPSAFAPSGAYIGLRAVCAARPQAGWLRVSERRPGPLALVPRARRGRGLFERLRGEHARRLRLTGARRERRRAHAASTSRSGVPRGRSRRTTGRRR